MYVCTYIRMHAYVHVCVCVYVYVYMYIYIFDLYLSVFLHSTVSV